MVRLAFGMMLSAVFLLGMRAQAAPPVEAYGKLPAIEDVSLSPSGDRYAFIATTGDKRRLITATTDGKPLQIADVGDLKVRSLEWAGENHVLVTTTATVTLGPEFTVWEAELATVISMNVDTGKLVQVFARHERVVVNTVFGKYGTAELDGHWYGWFGARSCKTDKTGCYGIENWVDLYRVDLDTGDISIAARGQQDGDGWLVSGKGEVLARALYNERGASWWIKAGRNGDQVLASGKNDFGGVGELQLGRTPDTVLVDLPTGATDAKKGAYDYRELSLSSVPEKGIDTAGMDEPLIDPSTHLWIGKITRSDTRDAVLFPPMLQARWQGTKKAFPNYIVHLVSWSADFNKLVVQTEGGDDSGTFWFVDIAKHSADPIGGIYPGVKQADVGSIQSVSWRAEDGMQLYGVLTLPPGKPAKGLPLVVLPHGGPEARDYLGFDWWAQAFASRGYAVFQPNFRGSDGYGVEFRNAGLGQWGRKMQTDISDGVADLAKKGIVDPKRACIIGASYGGYAALAGVTVQQGLYRCAVSVAGVADLSDMLNYQHKKRAGSANATMRYWRAFMGVEGWGESSQVRPYSPAELADKADAPILLIHGTKDTVVPIDQSETMESALRHAGKPVEFVKMDNEDHWLSREETRVQMLTAAVAFVQKHNPPN
jgi:dipeptidyl aminopeptidase/acylaminoacyl peptidase